MWDDSWLAGLERVVLVLFVLTVAGALVSLAGWSPGWWSAAWQVVGLVFVLVLLVYLSVGGGERMARSKVGALSLVLLALTLLANLADTFLELDSAGWRTARGVVTAGFFVCFGAYLAVRHRRRTASHP